MGALGMVSGQLFEVGVMTDIDDILQAIGATILCRVIVLLMLCLFGYVFYAGWFTITRVIEAVTRLSC